MQNKGYSADWLEKLKYSTNIVDIVSSYVSLTRKGNSFWACCPFHHEKTPSFSVNSQGQFYHCFGCGESGDVITFVQKMEGTDFIETVKILADKVGMKVPELKIDEDYIKNKKHRETLQEICRQSAIFYNKTLSSPAGKKGLNYLLGRGITQSTITKLGLGYSPNWTGLVTFLKSKGFYKNDIVESGVCGEKDGKLFDEMANRVVFPVIDHMGKVVGFSGRALESTAYAKYKNTRATPLFNKSSNIYCINFLRKARLEKNYAILVEGQIDVVSLQQAGFGNAIATMGTAFNKNHVQTLSRFVDNVIVCFDGDNAGKKATVKSLEPLLDEDLNIKVIMLPEKLDPDEYIKKYGAEEYQKLIDSAMGVYEFEIRYQAETTDLTKRENISKFIDNCLKIVVGIKKESERQVYIDLIASISNVPRETILRQYLSIANRKTETNSQNNTVNVAQSKNYKAEQFVLASVLHKKSYVHGVEIDDFVNNNFKTIYSYLEKNDFPIVSKLYDDFDVEQNEELKELINFNFSNISNEKSEFEGCLNALELDRLIAKQNQINAQIQTCTNEEVKLALLKKASELSKEINDKKAKR
ncbi:MAG: DNA primase [Clostridia bacterium]|nr:DNA primase [Clostridia bacterium]